MRPQIVLLAETMWDRAGVFIFRTCVSQGGQISAPTKMKKAQCNQPSARWLAASPSEWDQIRVSVLILVPDAVGPQQWC